MSENYRQPCCGLSNRTGAVIIGILQIVLSTILIATYAMGLKFISLGKAAMLSSLQTEAGIDFVGSLGLNSSRDRVLMATLTSYVIIYSFKILLGFHLLGVLGMDSLIQLKLNAFTQSAIFAIRFILHIISVVLVHNFAVGIIVVYSFSLGVEIFCVWIIWLLCSEMKQPSWGTKQTYPEGLRVSSRNMYAKQFVVHSKNLLTTSLPLSEGNKCP